MIFELDYEKRYWDAINTKINNEYGTAGLMGNLKAESGLIPYRKENDNTPPYLASQQYTNNVDSGIYTKSEFVGDEIGYGLAQWTFSTRKEKLYNFHLEDNVSIGDFNLSLKMLFYELEGSYINVFNILKNANNVREASDSVLHDYESPGDQGESVEIYRAQLGQAIYDKYAGSPPEPPEPPVAERKKMKLWFYTLKRNNYIYRRK